jgi:hypothetical protein
MQYKQKELQRRLAMRCAIKRLTLLAAALMLMAMPVLAADDITGGAFNQEQQGVKDECLLASNNCKSDMKPIEQKIEKLRNEIGRGTTVYTNDELNKLKRELDDANKSLMEMYEGGA